MKEQSLSEITKKHWQLSGWNVAPSLRFLRGNMHAMTDPRVPWPIKVTIETDSSHCSYKYWVWRPFSNQPKCWLLSGAECTPESCPLKIPVKQASQ